LLDLVLWSNYSSPRISTSTSILLRRNNWTEWLGIVSSLLRLIFCGRKNARLWVLLSTKTSLEIWLSLWNKWQSKLFAISGHLQTKMKLTLSKRLPIFSSKLPLYACLARNVLILSWNKQSMVLMSGWTLVKLLFNKWNSQMSECSSSTTFSFQS